MAEQFDELAYYKDLYEKEAEITDRINGRVGNSLTLLTIIGGGHALLISDIYSLVKPFSFWWVIITLLCLASGLLFSKALWYFRKAYRGYGYTYYPIEDMEESLKCVRENNTLQQEFISQMTELYKTGAITNRALNQDKNATQHKLTGAIIWSFIVMLCLFVVWHIVIKPLL